MQIIKVREDLINETSAFAQDVFIDYYQSLIGDKQARYMADLFLSEKAIADLINNGAIFIIIKENNKILGFSEYMLDNDRVFLSKLYVHKDYRGKGIGKILFNECKKYTKENNLNRIYLTVNKYNLNSYNIYLHLGFKVIESVVNDIGNGYVMDDYVMELKI